MTSRKEKYAVSGIRHERIEKFKRNFSRGLTAASRKMAPLSDALAAMAPMRRIAIVTVFFVALAVVFYMFSYKPKAEKLADLTQELEQLDARIKRAQAALPALKTLENKKEAMDLSFQEAMGILPASHEIPVFLSEISFAGREAGLEFVSFKPEKEVLKDFYAEIPVSVEISGSFHNTVIFLDTLAQMPRLVHVRNLRMQSAQNREKSGAEVRAYCQIILCRFLE